MSSTNIAFPAIAINPAKLNELAGIVVAFPSGQALSNDTIAMLQMDWCQEILPTWAEPPLSSLSAAANGFDDAEQQFCDAAAQRGLIIDRLIADGEIHRCDVGRGKRDKGDGSYLLRLNGGLPPWGWFENHKDGRGVEFWKFNGAGGRQWTEAEKAELKRQQAADKEKRDKKRAEEYAAARKRAEAIVRAAIKPPADHPYYVKKGIKPVPGVLFSAAPVAISPWRDTEPNVLIVPMRDIEGVLHSVQFIDGDGHKDFLAGGRKGGCLFTISHDTKLDPTGLNLVCEGLSTGASCHEAANVPAICAFDAGNLSPVISAVHKKRRKASFLLCGDDDWKTEINGKPNNTGKIKAEEAAKTHGIKCVFPVFDPATNRHPKWSDFNDLHQAEGLDAVRRCLNVTPPPPPPPPKSGSNNDEDLYTEKSLAKLFAEENKPRFRHVAKWGQWLEFTGTHWREDETLHAFDEISALCERTSLNCEERSKTLELARTVNAVHTFARADRRLAGKADQWDLDRMLLNTPSGVVDLRTGKVRPHRADDYMRMIAGTSPDPHCPIDNWLKFLEKISGGNQDWIDYLQRVSGYSTTGDVSLQALFFGYGTGANGKGVFINAISACLGEYHRPAGIETFVETQYDRHTTELARLQGRRFVTVGETPPGKRWDEAKLKTLSGGDRVTARFMRKDDFEFDPQAKLFFAGNHKPGLRGVDEAWRRRFRLIPFTVTIAKDERDPDLFEKKLRPELPGILAWMIRGYRDLVDLGGLVPPAAVKDATEAYLSEQDVFGTWLQECCEEGSGYLQRRSELWTSWKGWTERSNEWTGSKKEFWTKLSDKGFTLDEDRTLGFFYRGVKLK